MDFKTFLHAGSNRRAMLKGMGVAAVGFTLTGALAGCGEKDAKKLANGEEAKLNFYNWDTYIGETTLEDYNEASGVDVNMTLFASNDELFAKLRAGNQGYDVIVPSNDFVERMASADMLMELDKAQIPNFKNVANHSFFALPNCSTSTQLSAPPMTAHSAITSRSISSWRLVRSMRGSGTCRRCSIRLVPVP